MPRSSIADRRQQLLDALLLLRDYSGAALSATTSETGISLNSIKEQAFKAVVSVAAYTGYVVSTAVWTITIEVATTQGGSYSTIATYTTLGTAAEIEVPLSGFQIAQILAGALWIRVTATKTGSPGNLTYGAFVTRESNN
jgi:hypothetical protein